MLCERPEFRVLLCYWKQENVCLILANWINFNYIGLNRELYLLYFYKWPPNSWVPCCKSVHAMREARIEVLLWYWKQQKASLISSYMDHFQLHQLQQEPVPVVRCVQMTSTQLGEQHVMWEVRNIVTEALIASRNYFWRRKIVNIYWK